MSPLAPLKEAEKLVEVFDCIRKLFPFHFVVDREMRLVQIGEKIKKIDPTIKLGTKLDECFGLRHPFVRLDFEDIVVDSKRTFIFSFYRADIRLKGQMLKYTEEGLLLFAGSPIISDGKAILKTDLILSDFAPYDCLPDFLFNMNALEISYKEIKHLVNDLHEHKLQLLKVNEKLSKFAAVASHDLQSPLRTIANFSQILKNKCSHEDKVISECLDFIISSTRRMQSLVKGLLDYSRSHDNQINYEKVNLNTLIDEILHDNSYEIQKQGATIDFSSLPTIKASPIFIRQLFHNTIFNAMKYRKPDVPPHVEVQYKDIGSHWLFSVKDNGIGFTEEEGKKIFDIFQRVASKEMQYEGTGIGLSVCKKIVQNHRGEIWAESKPNEGSVFYFSIAKDL